MGRHKLPQRTILICEFFQRDPAIVRIHVEDVAQDRHAWRTGNGSRHSCIEGSQQHNRANSIRLALLIHYTKHSAMTRSRGFQRKEGEPTFLKLIALARSDDFFGRRLHRLASMPLMIRELRDALGALDSCHFWEWIHTVARPSSSGST